MNKDITGAVKSCMFLLNSLTPKAQEPLRWGGSLLLKENLSWLEHLPGLEGPGISALSLPAAATWGRFCRLQLQRRRSTRPSCPPCSTLCQCCKRAHIPALSNSHSQTWPSFPKLQLLCQHGWVSKSFQNLAWTVTNEQTYKNSV